MRFDNGFSLGLRIGLAIRPKLSGTKKVVKKRRYGLLNSHGFHTMSKKTSTRQAQTNHRADALNNNRGTSGTNVTNAMVHGNRGKQLNPNQGGTARQSKPIPAAKPTNG